MLRNLIWVDDSILGGNALRMLSTVPIQAGAQTGLSSTSSSSSSRRSPPRYSPLHIIWPVSYSLFLLLHLLFLHPRLLSGVTLCFSFYWTNNTSRGRNICLRGSDGGFGRLDVKRGDAAEQLTEYSGQLTAEESAIALRPPEAERNKAFLLTLLSNQLPGCHFPAKSPAPLGVTPVRDSFFHLRPPGRTDRQTDG